MKKRKVLFLTSHRDRGGAAKALYRIYTGLEESGDFELNGIYIGNVKLNKLWNVKHTLSHLCEQILRKISGLNSNKALFSFSFFHFYQEAILEEATKSDVIFLGWVNNSFLSLELIGDLLALGKPVFWRLSDMWPFTGGCHYSDGCLGFKNNCSACPNGIQIITSLLTKAQLSKKISKWNTDNLTVICPSAWIKEQSLNSRTFKTADHQLIKTGVDLNLYKAIDSGYSREILKLPKNKFLIGISADKLQTKRKGVDLLISCLNSSTKKDAFECVFFGETDKKTLTDIDFPYQWIGHISGERDLNLAYSSLDIYIAPYREENLPNTVLEALASGVPVIAFAIGGMVDVIFDGINGYLIKPFDLERMRDRIEQYMSRNDTRAFRQRAREVVVQKFDLTESVTSIRDLLLKKGNHDLGYVCING